MFAILKSQFATSSPMMVDFMGYEIRKDVSHFSTKSNLKAMLEFLEEITNEKAVSEVEIENQV